VLYDASQFFVVAAVTEKLAGAAGFVDEQTRSIQVASSPRDGAQQEHAYEK
jgi:hypothetical protein